MKNFLFLFLAGALACSAVENMMPDPGFENWTGKGWRWGIVNGKSYKVPLFEKIEKSSAFAHSGKFSLHLKDAEPGRSNSVYSYSLSPSEVKKLIGKTISFSCYVKQIKASSAQKVGIGLLVSGTKGYRNATDMIDSAGETGWTHLLVRLPVPDGANRICLNFICANHFGQTAEACFDDIVFTTENIEKEISLPQKKSSVPAKLSNSLSFHPSIPSSWRLFTRGNLKFRQPPGKTRVLELIPEASSYRHGEIVWETNSGNRFYDLSQAKNVFFTFLSSTRKPMDVRFWYPGGRLNLKDIVTPEGKEFRHTFKVTSQDPPSRLSCIQVMHGGKAEANGFTIRNAELAADQGSVVGKYAFFPEGKALADKYNAPMVFKNDPWTRPSIKDGTWYKDGKYEYYLGPFVTRHGEEWFKDKKYNPCNIQHPAYLIPPGKELFGIMGFNSSQLSAAPSWLCSSAMGLGIPKNIEQVQKEFAALCSHYKGEHMVADFAYSPDSQLASERPELYREIDQRLDLWHSFVPVCPECPEGDLYYTSFMQGGTKVMLENKVNVGVWELFNESMYGCHCKYNTADFARRMEKKYTSIGKANAVWGTSFASFRELGACGNMKDFKGLWIDWWDFLALRYAEVLTKYTNVVRAIDQRPNVYFTEQLSVSNVWRGYMDYRRVRDALDVLAVEGGWHFGHAALKPEKNVETGMEAVVFGGQCHWYIMDFFQAVTRGKKPIINNEHYCWRSEYGHRVPSKRGDMITALWTELMHGSSGNYTYAWSKRWFDYKDYEGAKNTVWNLSYKSSNLLNPYNWPPEELSGYRIFQEELTPYKQKLMPFPRTKAPTVAVYHSFVTQAMTCIERNMDIRKAMESWYSLLLHNQYPVTFIFDDELDRIPGNIRTILVPAADFERPEAVSSLKKFAEKGGLVIADTRAFRFDERGKKRADTGPFVRLDASKASSAKEILKLLAEKKVVRYGSIEPADGRGPIQGTDLQIIDRGDFKFVLLVSMGELSSRLANVRFFLKDPGEFYMKDIVSKRLIVPAKGETWNAQTLASGVRIALPSQERVLLVLEKAKPGREYRPFTENDMKKYQDSLYEKERTALEKFRTETEKRLKANTESRIDREVRPERCEFVDLRRFANMDIRDEKGDDRKGGGFDQGLRDFSNLPSGKVICARVPYMLMDRTKNNFKAMITLGCIYRNYFPVKVTDIPLSGKANAVYFLHTIGWGGPQGETELIYRIRYADDSSVDIPVRMGIECQQWMVSPGKHPSVAKIGLDSINGEGTPIQLQSFRWKNPHPDKELKSLDMISTFQHGVPAIFAVTLER